MSVPVPQRGQGKLEASVKALELCTYTIQITSNPNVFVEKFQKSVTDNIVDTAIKIYTICWTANNILVDSPKDLEERLYLQEQACIQCNILLALIEIAHKLFHLRSKRVTYWSKKTIEARNLSRAWREADRKRYSEKLGM